MSCSGNRIICLIKPAYKQFHGPPLVTVRNPTALGYVLVLGLCFGAKRSEDRLRGETGAPRKNLSEEATLFLPFGF